ncbi:nitrite/sulfite reductase [Anaerobacillus isosaccharinicus]|uniref:Nitrite/sulfite reductase n=1 Tax=Anaerobacillus isosaccharinicus TaxID=1532552 RepID=A0A7S7L760_9BACI|nr:nitrite/sulfite reductase [Anaerobacillus isosaccharinicus]MBA5586024.1 nitrite/sulfite reductase [Anaerobacillus isosaccharinicus]QOY35699.1 nitrite/sulfite reductase [Anaerobacillus isosaccharinicus]
MAYEQIWANDESKLSKEEIHKLKKDGLDILNDIDRYAKEGFASIPEEDWGHFKWAGLYLQKPKEAGYFMMRVNIPTGIITNEQALTLANIGKDYGRDVIDITTRQAIQYHWLTIEQLPDIYKRLGEVGLSSIGACGDIPRTIIGNPLAGIDRNELMDTREIVNEVYHFFQRNEDFSNLPRKFKMSISANVQNAGHDLINCLAFTPAVKVIDDVEQVGFHVKVGGGLSSKPYLAEELDVFVLPEQVKDVAIAVTTIYRDYGYRQKRHRARLKFLIADWGPEKFREKLLEVYGSELHLKGEDKVEEWNAGYFYGVHQQKQEGLSYAGFNVPVGRMNSEQLIQLATVAKKYGNGEIRTCNSQNIVIPNVPDGKMADLLAEPVFEKITIKPKSFIGYSVACTGIEYCNLALVETKETTRKLAEYLDEQIELDVPVRIHMVGCPNSCGQRQIADIGLQGVLMKTKEAGMVEAFEIYVGGTLEKDHAKFNEKLKGRVTSENLPAVLKDLFVFFKEEKHPGENFFDFAKRVGVETLQGELDKILAEA